MGLKVTFVESLGFLPVTPSTGAIYLGTTEIFKSLLCCSWDSVAGSTDCLRSWWSLPAQGFHLCLMAGFLICHPSTRVACWTWSIRPCARTANGKPVGRWRWAVSPFTCKVGALLWKLPCLIQHRNSFCPWSLTICPWELPLWLSGALGLVPNSPLLFCGGACVRSKVIFAPLLRFDLRNRP